MYKNIKYQAKNVIKYIYGMVPLRIRYGDIFRKQYDFLKQSQGWNKAELERYQVDKVQELINHAYKNIPYYQKVFDERGLKPENIASLDDLKKIPFLTKEIAKENLPELVAKNFKKTQLVQTTTGGTTGTPLTIISEKNGTEAKEWAFVWRQWNWAGLNFGQKKVIIRGNVINRVKNGRRVWWEYDPLDNSLKLSSYDMTEENLPEYVRLINRFNPVAIRGYPSSLSILANYLKRKKKQINDVRCVLTSSETLYDHQREDIERYLRAKIFDHYGNTERSALIMQCENGNYHSISEYGVIELIGSNGRFVKDDGEVGEIVATSFNNYACPLLRYRTRDLGVFSNKVCNCGKSYPVIERIEGRTQDFFVSFYNDLIPLTGSYGLIAKCTDNVIKSQFYQEEKGKVLLKIVKKSPFSNEDRDRIIAVFQKKYGKALELIIKFVEDIPRTERGKYRYLIQKIPINH